MTLFEKKDIILSSGIPSTYKIDCDALTDTDIECIAHMIQEVMAFREVHGVPTGGNRLRRALEPYAQHGDPELPVLICDDVLTTGTSMAILRGQLGEPLARGVVIIARGKCPSWITPVLQLTMRFRLRQYKLEAKKNGI